MCAPKYQQSAASHRFTLVDPLYAAEYPVQEPGCRAWAITGSPADCVRIGLNQLVDRPVDVVISGINDGYNAGVAIHYSGTVGAAMEGAFHYLPSIATSIHHKATPEMLDHLARFTIEMAEKYAGATVPRATILNINAPCVEPDQLKEPIYAPLDSGYFTDGYERRTSPRAGDYFWMVDGDLEAPEKDTDCWYLNEGHITLTLMGHFISESKAFWDTLGMR